MKKLLFGLFIILCISSISWAQSRFPAHPGMFPQQPQHMQHQVPQQHYQVTHYQGHYYQPHYYHPYIIYYPLYYNNYPYYNNSYPYYQNNIQPEPAPEPVNNDLALRVRQGYVKNPVTDRLEWRFPGYWKQNEDGIWIYKHTTEWPLPGHWTE